ncbi:MAG: substrate-binding domain-containing protein [Eubacteriales bacterium]|nr:substrate-binding domain-containing protein [Eubacteriales bacterium]
MKHSRMLKAAFAVILLTGCLIAGAAGMGSMKVQEAYEIAVIAKSTESAFWKTVFAGANAAGTEYNVKLTVQGPDTEEDYEAQNDMIRQAVESGADAIVFSAVDFNANASAVDEAVQNGVEVVVIDSDVNSDAVSCRISTDNYAAGRMAGEAALSCAEETLYVGIVNFDEKTANGQQRELGFREVVEQDPRVKFIETINVLSTTEDARRGMIQLLEEHPEINVVATFNEWTSLGVGWAIRDLDLKEQTTVVAFDSNVVSVGMLETGEVDALIVQNPYAMGYLGIETAYQLLSGKKPGNARVDTETTLVTRENMFSEDCQKILFTFD